MPLSKAAVAALPLALVAAVAALPTSTPPASPSAVNATSSSSALYVSRGGSDSNPGTWARPFRQINRAAAAATPGTFVHVGLGVYNAVTTERSGQAGAPITFVSDARWGRSSTPSAPCPPGPTPASTSLSRASS